jgi:mono/diheme cytochrome c family protein
MRLPLLAATWIALVLAFVTGAGAVDFDADIRPLLRERCNECHGEKKQKGELRLDLRAQAQKGGDTGPAWIAGNADSSLLLKRVNSPDEDERMPPKGERLTSVQVQKLREWINQGAHWPESDADRAAATDKRLQHWSFQALAKPAAHADIDALVESKLRASGLSLSPEADRRTLMRRLYLDVLGLPPERSELEAFIAEKSSNSYEKLVERVLESPRFGERWARHWLDVARFAESHGFEMNQPRNNAWHYRDYVIRAFNEDRPFDRFIKDQLAGDNFGEDAATGFLVGGPMDQVKSKDPVLTANQRADELHDMVSTTCAVFLGLTVNCARCHDHKFDPIPAEDYYGITAIFQGVKHGERPIRTPKDEDNSSKLRELKERLKPLEEKLVGIASKARLQRIILVDDALPASTATKAGTTQIRTPDSQTPTLYSPGREKGQAEDLGDSQRFPNIAESYKFWRTQAAKPEDVFAWEPRVSGLFRIWVSWGAWTSHTATATYVLDSDGNPTTTNDQVELATFNQSQFADGSPAVPEQRRWSGFKATPGLHRMTDKSTILLRSGSAGGPLAADVIALEEASEGQPASQSPRLRAPVRGSTNEEVFEAAEARFVKFTVNAASARETEPCIDEVEVFTAETQSRNVALAKNGANLTVSGTYANGSNPKHQAKNLNDGKYGNDFSWISNESNRGWIQIEFAKSERINRILWSRDRSNAKKPFNDRLATNYRIEVSQDGKTWKAVAGSVDRLGQEYAAKTAVIPTLHDVPQEKAEQVAQWSAERAQLSAQIQKLSAVPMVYAGVFEQPSPTRRNHRGDPTQPKEEVPPGALSRIGPQLQLDAGAPERERRLAFANWIASPQNPLTARVIVNRLWHYHFGAGIVETPSDFGLNGARPTHPELLDWLAAELIESGWSLKHIHRLILLSRTYRQSSAYRADAFAKDSNSRLLWRFPPRRIEAETLRDAMLVVTGKLDLTAGGPGFDLFEPNNNYVRVYRSKEKFGPEDFRRMVYATKTRMALDDFSGAFDCPDGGQPAPKRTSSTTPLQALNMLNGPFAMQQAGFFADRIKSECGSNLDAQVRCAFRLAFGRDPDNQELQQATDLVGREGLATLTRALLNANEFVRLN